MRVGRLEGKVAIVTGGGLRDEDPHAPNAVDQAPRWQRRLAAHRERRRAQAGVGFSIIIPTRFTRTTTSSRWL